jgi:hypothetical protein
MSREFFCVLGTLSPVLIDNAGGGTRRIEGASESEPTD